MSKKSKATFEIGLIVFREVESMHQVLEQHWSRLQCDRTFNRRFTWNGTSGAKDDCMNLDERARFMVLSYFNRHPLAQDTPEGITKWWLLEEEIYYRLNSVRSVLKQLSEEGYINEMSTPDGYDHYALEKSGSERVSAEIERLRIRALDLP